MKKSRFFESNTNRRNDWIGEAFIYIYIAKKHKQFNKKALISLYGMLNLLQFQSFTHIEKISFLKDTLKDKYQTSKILKKLYFFITSEFEISDNTLDEIYEWVYLAVLQKKEKSVKKSIEKIKDIEKQDAEEFDETYLNNLLSKIEDGNSK